MSRSLAFGRRQLVPTAKADSGRSATTTRGDFTRKRASTSLQRRSCLLTTSIFKCLLRSRGSGRRTGRSGGRSRDEHVATSSSSVTSPRSGPFVEDRAAVEEDPGRLRSRPRTPSGGPGPDPGIEAVSSNGVLDAELGQHLVRREVVDPEAPPSPASLRKASGRAAKARSAIPGCPPATAPGRRSPTHPASRCAAPPAVGSRRGRCPGVLLRS
jgi:hypothetical protein